MSTAFLDLPVGAVTGDRITRMVDVLRWSGPAPEAMATHRDYVLLLGDRLGAVLASAGDNAYAQKARTALAALPDHAWVRLIGAPQCSYRLLWPSRHSHESVIALMADAADVEVARLSGSSAHAGHDYPGPEVKWSILGDGWLNADGAYVRGPSLTSFPPIDVASPHALAIDLEGVTDEATEPRRPLDKPVLERVLGALADTRDRIESTNPDILEFVNAFTKVLVLQRDDAAPTLFSTGSSAQYVGRSVFGNPHLESVDAALLAEGLVHEAIHSLLYMGERIEPWVTTPELYGPEHRTRSGWTGNPLPLRSYLQAAFVWYGLSQFWCQALSAGTFPADRIRGRIEQSVRGFLRGSVLDQIQPYRYGIAPEVCSAIESMESDIVDAVGAAC